MYKVCTKVEYEYEGLRYREIIPSDIERIRIWRNNQKDVLRQSTIISKEEQISYFNNYVWSEYKKEEPNQILFSIVQDETHIGYCGLVHVNWKQKSAELSFLLSQELEDDACTKIKVFGNTLMFLSNIACKEIKLNAIWTETYVDRDLHIKILEDNNMQRIDIRKYSNILSINARHISAQDTGRSVFHANVYE